MSVDIAKPGQPRSCDRKRPCVTARMPGYRREDSSRSSAQGLVSISVTAVAVRETSRSRAISPKKYAVRRELCAAHPLGVARASDPRRFPYATVCAGAAAVPRMSFRCLRC